MREKPKRYLQSIDSDTYIDEVLTTIANDVHFVNDQNGWFEGKDHTFGDNIALLHTEVSEVMEAFRIAGVEDMTAGCAITPGGDAGAKPEGVGSELADVLIRLVDFCTRYDIDLPAEYRRKMKYNRTRGYRHGGKRL